MSIPRRKVRLTWTRTASQIIPERPAATGSARSRSRFSLAANQLHIETLKDRKMLVGRGTSHQHFPIFLYLTRCTNFDDLSAPPALRRVVMWWRWAGLVYDHPAHRHHITTLAPRSGAK